MKRKKVIRSASDEIYEIAEKYKDGYTVAMLLQVQARLSWLYTIAMEDMEREILWRLQIASKRNKVDLYEISMTDIKRILKQINDETAKEIEAERNYNDRPQRNENNI